MTHQQTPEPRNGVDKGKGLSLRWDGTINAGAILQAITVTIVIGGGIMAYSAFTTATNLRLTQNEKTAADNQAAILEKFSEAKTEAANRDAAWTKSLTDLRTDLSSQQQQTASNVAQLQRTIDQTLPRLEDWRTQMTSQIADIYARLKSTEDGQEKLDRRTFDLEQFKSKVESGSPSTRRTGG